MADPTILLSAGEPSGDLHGGALARALRERWPGARLFGLGGPRMAEAGVELLADLEQLAVMGFVEVLRHLPFHVQLFRRLKQEFHERRPDLVLPIDYPGFNLRLAKEATRAGIPVLYYIAPQVWAWHRSRVRLLAEYTDRVAVVLPFEEAIFREAGVRAEFVGHPLLDLPVPAVTREEFCEGLGLDAERPILALMPGSRSQEVSRHLELFVETAKLVQARRPEVQPVIAASPAVPAEAYSGVPFPRTRDSRALLRHARAGLVKSGTGTLEAALAGMPLVIVYRTHPVTYWLARRLVRVDSIGLVNLVAGERVAPEFIQGDAKPPALAEALVPLLAKESEARQKALDGLARVSEALRPAGGEGMRVADRVVALAAELLGRWG
mgnify:CR=1 FL=1|jgi:lipid-A-disaccharide synthase